MGKIGSGTSVVLFVVAAKIIYFDGIIKGGIIYSFFFAAPLCSKLGYGSSSNNP